VWTTTVGRRDDLQRVRGDELSDRASGERQHYGDSIESGSITADLRVGP
jgi:hypothetical protein